MNIVITEICVNSDFCLFSVTLWELHKTSRSVKKIKASSRSQYISFY